MTKPAHTPGPVADLIRELRRLSDLFEHALKTPDYGHDNNSLEEACEAIVAARAALAKAEGRS